MSWILRSGLHFAKGATVIEPEIESRLDSF